MELLVLAVCWLIAMSAYCLHFQYHAYPLDVKGCRKVLLTIRDTTIGIPCATWKEPLIAIVFAVIMALPFLNIALFLYVGWIPGVIMSALLVTAWMQIRTYIKVMSKKGI